ncbi:phage tail spike protein [Staphylococcus simulans]|uniref:phage tail spike protein n=1 Tax=Staphylococcus simulans TaxID=1286 RepID=UPI003BB7298D
MLHVLDFEGNIIDFISDQDNYLENALMVKDKAETLETFEFDVDSDRAENMRERNRIIVQDSNGQYREFIIVRIEDDLEDRTFVECNASYLEDINTAKPLAPGKYEAMTTSQALKEVLKDTGWQASESTEYGGTRSTSWTAYHTPYEVLKQLGTTYDMEIDFYIELGSNKVKGRYVEMHKPKPLFKGKEITYGKDLTGMSKTVDISELHTALMALGPEDENGNREVLTVVDNTAHQQFGLPNRYIWGIYEPQSEDTSMTAQRLKTLATTQLNKDKQAAVSYEITAADISQQFPHEKTAIGDIVRVKDREFNPPLYIEAEVMREEYNPIKKESTYTFGNIVEYLESTLRKDFMDRLNDIRQKMNDSVTNLNTIIEQTTAGNLETFERKIFKSDTAPANPVNDMLWYDTSNPEVAVLRRYWNGEWREETVSDVEQIGGVTREKALFSELSNAFINLNIQHSKLLSEVYEVIDSEYLVDTALKQQVQQNLDSTINVYNTIKTNLESMTPETATLGKLVDTQALFLKYRELLKTLYNSLENAKIAIDDRFKLLQSQYTDEKFNDAMSKVAEGIGGTWNAETGQLLADIPSQQELEDALKTYINGQDAALKQLIDGEVNSKITQTKNELSSNISAVSAKVDGIQVGGRNLLPTSYDYYNVTGLYGYIKVSDDNTQKVITITDNDKTIDMSGVFFGFTKNGYDANAGVRWEHSAGKLIRNFDNDVSLKNYNFFSFFPKDKATLDKIFKRYKIKLEKGTIATDYTVAPEDTEETITTVQTRFNNDIKQLQDGITLKADKTELTTMYDTNIKPLETQVNEQKSQLDILPAQINSKVSQSTYDADINNIVSRLSSADTQRQQLSNAINDRVTIKEYTDNKTATTNQISTAVNNVQVGGRNLLENSANINKATNDTSNNYNQYWATLITSAHSKLQLGETITISFDVQMERGEILRVYDTLTNYDFMFGEKVFTNLGNKKQRLSFTLPLVSTTKSSTVWNLSFYNNNNGDRFTIENIKIEKGNKATDWTPAPEDTQAQITKAQQEAENAAKAYADAQDDLKQTEANAYADGLITAEEQRAIQDAQNKLAEAKKYSESKSSEAQSLAEKYALTKSNEALENANKYTDDKKAEVEKTLTIHDSRITQNGSDINARATKEEFNASRKTLSKVVSDLTINTTTGLTLSYDENGNITSSTVGPDGIMLKGDRVNINVNKDFQVLAGNVNNKVGKDEIINRLNLSPEGLDINVNNLGIRGGDTTNYLTIKNQEILSRGIFTRTWGGVTDTPTATVGIKDGYILSRNQKTGYSLYMTEKGLSTMMSGGVGSEQAGALEFHYDLMNDNSRGVRLSSTYGVVFLHAESSRIYTRSRLTTNIETWEASVYIRPQVYSRPGVNEFSFYVKDNDNAKDADGTLLFGEIYNEDGQAGSGIRFKKAGFSGQTEGDYEPVVYATDKFGNIGTGSFHARTFYGDFQSRSGYLYLKANNRVRITDYKGYNDGNPNYVDLQCRWIQSESIRTTSTNFYIGTSTGEVRVTNNLLYNDGNIGYKPIRAEAFYNSSLVDYKKDIEKWDYDALNVIANELQLYQYKYKKDAELETETDEYNHRGVIIGNGYETPPEFIYQDGVNLYEMVSWSLRAIQQLNNITKLQEEKIKQLEEQLNESK